MMSNEIFDHRGSARRVTLAPWVLAHEAVLEVAKERALLERREGKSLLCAFRERVHWHLGYGAFAEYTDRHLGYCHRTAADKLRTAEALEQLPELARAQQEGRLHASAVRELARVATVETEDAWIEAARGRRVREIERMVSGRARGDSPTSALRPELEKHVLRFEVSAETLAAFRGAIRRINETSGEKLDDDSALLLLARAALSSEAGDGEADSLGRANYQVAVFECEHCKRAFQPAGADRVEIDAATLATARCDAQQVDLTHGAANPDDGAAPTRATQSVPPAIRRHVLLRDQRMCQVPGCRNTIALDVHHIQPRSEGGTHHAFNQVGLCTVHHRAVHRGEIHVSGRAPDGLVFQHADGTPYGGPVSAPRVDVCKKVYDGLCGLGFKTSEARRALDDCMRDGEAPLDTSTLLRKALERLGQRPRTTWNR
jgi:5-methylcytosine-specific restriction endonuclease McrA